PRRYEVRLRNGPSVLRPRHDRIATRLRINCLGCAESLLRCRPNDSRCGRRSLHCARHTWSDISSNATAILRGRLAVMPGQIFFFAQDLTVEQECGRAQINQSYPIWEDEEFSYQDNRKGHINGIATESKNAVGYEPVGMVSVNADSKALPKGNQAPQEQQQPRQAKQHSSPRDYLGMEKLVRRHGGPVECRGEQDIEIEQGKRRDQKIRLVYISESHRFYALSSQDRDSGQYHPKQQNDC